MRDPVKIYFGLSKKLGESLAKLKVRDTNATSFSTYDFLLFTRLFVII